MFASSAPFFCFHDADVRPEGASFAESAKNLDEIVDYFARRWRPAKTRLLWGTANLFSIAASWPARRPTPTRTSFACRRRR
jgi:xylose isomerase